MSRTHLTLPPRRIAILLIAVALLATLSPGLVVAANGAPHPNDDTITTAEEVAATGNVLANDVNNGDDPLVVIAVGALSPTIGTLTIEPDGDYTFTPATDWTGSASTTYDVSNGKVKTGNILITVTPTQDPPTANDDTIAIDEDTPTDVTAQIVANDTDPDSDTLSVTGVSNATGGSVDLTAGVVTFTPTADLCGDATAGFDYAMADGNGGTDNASVTIDIVCQNEAPVANDDSVTVDEDTATDVTSDLLANDTDPNSDTLSVSGVSNATGGSVDLAAGVVTFTPAADLCGDDSGSFDYDVSDGNGGSDSASVTVDITCENDTPSAADDTVAVTEDTATDVTSDLLTNDSDADGDTLAVSGVSNATGGTVDLTAGVVTFTPAADLCGDGEGSFDYDISDGNGGTDGASVTVDITCANDSPSAANDTVDVTEDTATDVTAQLLANDNDIDGDTLSVSGVSNATGGDVDLTAGVVTFTPDANLCGDGEGSFDYDISDGNGGTDSAHATVDLSCANDGPSAGDDSVDVTEDTATNVTAQLLANDNDVDGDSLSVTSVSNATGGTVDLTAGAVTFTPTANLCGDGVGGFDYDMSDGHGGSDSASATVDVTCVNDAPVAVDDTGNVPFAAPATDFDVLANDTDVEGDTRTLVSASVSPAAGTVSVVGGMVRFTPAGSFSGPAAISYVVSDGVDQDTGTLTVTVGPDTTPPVVTAPTITFGTGRVDESAPLLLTWTATDAGVGVASSELQVSTNGGSFTTIYTGPATTYNRLYALNKTFVWRVRATDNDGNVSAWTTSATRKVAAYQRNSTKLTYTGTWTKVTSAGSSGTGYSYTTIRGNRALLKFTGREVLYVAPKTTGSGYAKVYTDGVLIARFNLRASSTQLGQIITRKTWTSSGAHTMRVQNDQAGRRTSLDVFVVLQ
jgi:large repetitive protein